MQITTAYRPKIETIEQAAVTLQGVAAVTPLMESFRLSKQFDAKVFLKREDLQIVRSYKIRGAFNKINSLNHNEKKNGIVCASAGNHAQGVAFSCKALQIKGTIFMPSPTPKQKVEQVKMFGESYINVVLDGDTFDDSYQLAISECKRLNKTFIRQTQVMYKHKSEGERKGYCKICTL